ncbi:hypothetical protein EDC18_10669 [Natranaerovirga pectinivora]|uniref:GBS Bsp-like repeat-containing protein n=1 Tax=Natranaerovirga pectinivora TaxID=682400 RepID=A0A4R3MKP2_9FIRM|nr:hypothetical protein [Natranaerovirga pectinivora]TCT14273.1 hypothetical protein EDC18_10669 [Natranaerovirga pectinivora]
MKKIKKIICLTLMIMAFSITVSGSTTEIAGVEENGLIFQPMYSYINSVSTYLDISSGGTAAGTASVSTRNADSIRLTMQFQRYTNGSWQTIVNYGQTTQGNSAYMYRTEPVSKGFEYRVRLIVEVFSGGRLVETTTEISNYVLY